MRGMLGVFIPNLLHLSSCLDGLLCLALRRCSDDRLWRDCRTLVSVSLAHYYRSVYINLLFSRQAQVRHAVTHRTRAVGPTGVDLSSYHPRSVYEVS